MDVSDESLLNSASCEIDNALDNLHDLTLRFPGHDELRKRIGKSLTLLDVALAILQTIDLSDN